MPKLTLSPVLLRVTPWVSDEMCVDQRNPAREEEHMTREARLLSGIILITVPTIQYGGYFLLTSLMDKGSGYMENPLRQNFSAPDMPTRELL